MNLGVDLGVLLVNGDLMREAADEFEKVIAETKNVSSNELPKEWAVTLHPTMGTLSGCGLSLHQCSECYALVVEDFMPEHMEWHERSKRT